MPRNTLSDLNDHLFAELERLGDESLDEDGLEREIGRAKAIGGIARNVIDNAGLVVDTVRLRDEMMSDPETLPRMLGGSK